MTDRVLAGACAACDWGLTMARRLVLHPIAALLLVAAECVTGAGGIAAPGPTSPPATLAATPGDASSPPSGMAATTRQPLPPAASLARGPKLFERCTREAVARRYRGAERRHFVRRCQLGYGRRLFRRRQQSAGPT